MAKVTGLTTEVPLLRYPDVSKVCDPNSEQKYLQTNRWGWEQKKGWLSSTKSHILPPH